LDEIDRSTLVFIIGYAMAKQMQTQPDETLSSIMGARQIEVLVWKLGGEIHLLPKFVPPSTEKIIREDKDALLKILDYAIKNDLEGVLKPGVTARLRKTLSEEEG